VRLLAIRESRRMKKGGTIMRQPPTNRILYPDRRLSLARKGCTAEMAHVSQKPDLEATAR
jgi:hypothetical protein